MNVRRSLLAAVLVLALGACAGRPYHVEDPHHYSRDDRGRRLACFTTYVAHEYECVPVYRRVGPWYAPIWPHALLGFHYGWPDPYGYRYEPHDFHRPYRWRYQRPHH